MVPTDGENSWPLELKKTPEVNSRTWALSSPGPKNDGFTLLSLVSLEIKKLPSLPQAPEAS
jgi:hypothetical protein